MKHFLNYSGFVSLALSLATLVPSPVASAQGTAFTYQGRLNDGANPASGIYDLRFAIYDLSNGGTQQGNILTNAAVAVSNGLFTVTLDFGNQFPGANRWLEIAVRTNGAASFFTLNPRQALTPAPYAITAGSVVSGGLASGTYGSAVTLNNSANQISGSFTGNGVNLTNVNAATLNGLTSASFWKATGNSGADPANGAYLGSSDNLPMELRVNGQRAFRLEPGAASPNLIGGYAGNIMDAGVIGGFIGGGGTAGRPNHVSANYASVPGGLDNVASGYAATAFGRSSIASGSNSLAAGFSSWASGQTATALGTSFASGNYSTAMGQGSTASGLDAVAMGQGSQATGINSFASGESCLASDLATTAMGYHSMATNSGGTAIGVYATAGENAVALGAYAHAAGQYSYALGNYVYAMGNQSTAIGYGCLANGVGSMALGFTSMANASSSTAMGYTSEADHVGTFVWADASSDYYFQSTGNNQFLIRAAGGVGINTADPLGNALCVSGDARIDAQPAAWNEGLAINCPTDMSANGGYGGIHFHSTGSGQGFSSSSIKWSEMYNYAPEIGNAVGDGLAFIHNNSSTTLYLSPSGNVGIGTTAPASALHVKSASADCEISIHSGDTYDPAGAVGSPPVPGHRWTMQSSSPVATGQLRSSFQIIDRTLGVSRVLIDTSGNVGIGTTAPGNKLQVAGGITCTTLTQTSDRAAKENFQPVDAQAVLSKVAALPVSRWNYKEDKSQQHVGPMAQDFYAAFGVGPDDRHITTIDESGVALAAIQGLNQKLSQKDAEIAGLKSRLEKLEQFLERQSK